jgi:hypothetical protein
MGEPQDNRPSMKFVLLRNFLVKLISSFFFVGYLSLIPGPSAALPARGYSICLKPVIRQPTFYSSFAWLRWVC